MMSSILLNPQLMLYSTALGGTALAVRLISCVLCGMAVGISAVSGIRDGVFPSDRSDREPGGVEGK